MRWPLLVCEKQLITSSWVVWISQTFAPRLRSQSLITRGSSAVITAMRKAKYVIFSFAVISKTSLLSSLNLSRQVVSSLTGLWVYCEIMSFPRILAPILVFDVCGRLGAEEGGVRSISGSSMVASVESCSSSNFPITAKWRIPLVSEKLNLIGYGISGSKGFRS